MTAAVFPAPPRGQIRKIALPIEHGAWALAGEPILLGLVAVPSLAGAAVAGAAAATFLARQPVKIFLSDWYRGVSTPRSRTAAAVAMAYVALAAICLAAALELDGTSLLMPLFFALPFAAVQVAFDAVNESRQLLPEVCGTIGVSAAAAMIAIAGGAPALALPLWLLAAARTVGAVLHVRARLRLERLRRKGEAVRLRPIVPVAWHIAGVTVATVLVQWNTMGGVAVAAMSILLIRTLIAADPRRAVTPKQIGIAEVIYGALFVTLVASAA